MYPTTTCPVKYHMRINSGHSITAVTMEILFYLDKPPGTTTVREIKVDKPLGITTVREIRRNHRHDNILLELRGLLWNSSIVDSSCSVHKSLLAKGMVSLCERNHHRMRQLFHHMLLFSPRQVQQSL